jgi:hypothetical protein
MAPDMNNQTRSHVLGGLLQQSMVSKYQYSAKLSNLCWKKKETIYNIITYKTIQINWLLRNYGQKSLHSWIQLISDENDLYMPCQ